MGRYDSAGYYAFSALAIIDSTGDPNLKAKNLRVIGNIMYKTERHEEAVRFYLEALRLLQLHEDMPELKGRVYENLALAYLKLSRYNTAEQYFEKASKIYSETRDPRAVARLNLNMAALRQLQGKYEEAISRTQFALQFYTKINHANGIGECFLTLAETYYRMRNYPYATEYALKAVEAIRFRRDMDLQMSAYRILHKIHFETGNYKKAYQYQTAASLLQDSILSQKKAAVIAEMQNRLQIQTKENEIRLLDKDIEIKSLTVSKQNALRNSLLVIIAMVIIISVFLLNQYRISARRKRQYERRRISSDLHDDIGSGLSKITLLSQVLKQQAIDAHSVAQLEKISEAATDALEKMSELVWSLNPGNDRLGNLISYIRKYAVEYFEPTAISCKVSMPDEIPDKSIKGEQRRNIFLCVKEALHNIIKHAEASKVALSFSVSQDRVIITIQDNGKGFNMASAPGFGNGMLNMKQRMANVGGEFSIRAENGTRVTLELNLHRGRNTKHEFPLYP